MSEVTGMQRNALVAAAYKFRDQYTTVCLSTIATVEIFIFPIYVAMILMCVFYTNKPHLYYQKHFL